MPERLRFCLPVLLSFLLTACAQLSGVDEQRERYYLNADLGFAIEYPADWQRTVDLGSSPPVPIWSAPSDGGREPAQVAILSLPPAQAQGGVDRLERDFHAAHPDFTLQSRQEKLLPAAPARELTGQTAERAFLVYLFTSSQRAFVLEFSAPADDFEELRPLFREMAESFAILKRGKH